MKKRLATIALVLCVMACCLWACASQPSGNGGAGGDAAQDQKTLLEQHREIFDAFQKKDEARLCESLTNNILMGLRLIQKEMERQGKQC